jgi:hypothetical protein
VARIVEHYKATSVDKTMNSVLEMRTNLINNIERQRFGFRNIGSLFYDRLGQELGTNILESGPVWSVLGPFAGAPFEDAYGLRFLAGIHKLVLEGSAPNVAAHFPSSGGDGDAVAAMRAIVDLLEMSPGAVQHALAVPPQTNEVGRAPALASGLLFIARQFGMPIRLREIGSSGGLNLRLDSFWYEQDGQGWGTQESPLRFENLWVGGAPPFSSGAEILDRRGCDRHPIDVTSPIGALTLLSYVWPEPSERFVRLHKAIEVARRTPVVIDEADAATWVPRELAGRIQGTVMVIMHSVVWQYLEVHTADTITEAMAEAGADAKPDSPLAWLRLEPNPETYAPAELRVTIWDGSARQNHLLATTGFHGGSITWQATNG